MSSDDDVFLQAKNSAEKEKKLIWLIKTNKSGMVATAAEATKHNQ